MDSSNRQSDEDRTGSLDALVREGLDLWQDRLTALSANPVVLEALAEFLRNGHRQPPESAQPREAGCNIMERERTMPNRQIAPRPIGLHLWLAAVASTNSLSGLTGLKNGWPGWDSADAESLRDRMAEVDEAALANAIQAQPAAAFGRFLSGIAAYRQHPYRRHAAEIEVVAEIGSARLLRYAPRQSEIKAPAVLLVPSLVNRAYILDLMPGVSLAGYLAAAGVETYLVEWNAPRDDELGFTLTDLIRDRLQPAAAIVQERHGPPILAGYCMGGLLALALASIDSEVAGLALLATPWDFHTEREGQARALAALTRSWFPAFDALGQFPVDALQALFVANDPLVSFRKFRAFAELDSESEDARRFVALEDWLNDGIPLPVPVARETIDGWYGENRTVKGCWTVAGETIRPERLSVPALAIIPDQDRIVPQPSAMALARALTDCEIRIARAGHIGMMTGRRAERETWRPFLDWIRRQGGGNRV